jgi:hypothetical protein
MSCKSLLALPLVGALVLILTGSVLAESPSQLGPPDQLRTHTMTIYNGDHVMRRTFVWQNGSWRTCENFDRCDVFCRDCPRSPWQFYGTYSSPRRAEEVACFLRANGNLASVRHHCP